MPHNRTRLWVGLAIAAVTIPAVAQYYYSSATHDPTGNPISGSSRIDLASRQNDSFASGRLALRQSARDYDSEVYAALSKAGTTIPRTAPSYSEDPIFDLRPLDLPYGDDSGFIETRAVPRPAQNAAALSAPTTTAQGASPIDETETYDDQATAAVATIPVGMSDASIYTLVVENLNDEDRERFEQAYALMTPDQRIELMDSFRTSLQGNP